MILPMGPHVVASPICEPMAKPVLILNGPNLNMLGTREPAIYGSDTLDDIAKLCATRAKSAGLEIEFRQSNLEGELIGWIQGARAAASGIIVNAGGLTHTSVALLDALQAAELPVIEVHLSNIFRRDSFRQHSYVSLAATGVICGLGANGYELAIDAMRRILEKTPRS
jgi:3-dehydroquinate dehydratase II